MSGALLALGSRSKLESPGRYRPYGQAACVCRGASGCCRYFRLLRAVACIGVGRRCILKLLRQCCMNSQLCCTHCIYYISEHLMYSSCSRAWTAWSFAAASSDSGGERRAIACKVLCLLLISEASLQTARPRSQPLKRGARTR